MKTSNILIKKSKWKSFLFFLFLASLFWLLTKISKEFTAPITSSIHLKNIPEYLSVKDIDAKEITFNLFSSGYDFLRFTLKKPTLELDVSKFVTSNINKIVITNEQLIKEINEQFPSDKPASSLDLAALIITVDPIVKKKVPVLAHRKVTYKKGFKQIGHIMVSPDSIFVSGPQNKIALIDSLLTEHIVLDNVNNNINKKVRLLVPDTNDIILSNEAVEVSWVVKEMAQKEFEIPIEVINKPYKEVIKIIPNRLKIRVDITLDHYNDVTKKDFKIVCDYNSRNTDENFMIPHLDKLPKWVEYFELDTQKIDFLIFQ